MRDAPPYTSDAPRRAPDRTGTADLPRERFSRSMRDDPRHGPLVQPSRIACRTVFDRVPGLEHAFRVIGWSV